MVDFSKIVFKGEFKVVDSDGVEQLLTLRAVSPEHLSTLISAAKKFSKHGQENFLDALDEEMIKNLIVLAKDTMQRSYPSLSETERNEFVSNYFFELIPIIINLNLNKGRKQ